MSHSVQCHMHKRLLQPCRFGLPHLLDCPVHVFLPDWADEVFIWTVMGWRAINKELAWISFTMIQIEIVYARHYINVTEPKTLDKVFFFKSLICFVLNLKPFVKSLPFLAHKFTHTKQSRVSAHLSEVTSWEPISLFCNFTKVHRRLHLQKTEKLSF